MSDKYGNNVGGVPNMDSFYDKFVYDEMFFKKKRDGKHEVGCEVEAITPGAEEIRLLGNRHFQCRYYSIGVEVCHTAMLKSGSDNFLACK